MKSNDFFERLRIYSETDIEFEPRHSEWLNLKPSLFMPLSQMKAHFD